LSHLWTAIEARLEDEPQVQAPAKVVSFADERLKRRQTIRSVFAIAAAITLVFMGALLGPKIMQTENVIIERTIVIVDSIEYAPGASVMINGPVEAVSLEGHDDDAPTIIWLLDDEDEPNNGNGRFDQPI
jgi:hypothetical protein